MSTHIAKADAISRHISLLLRRKVFVQPAAAPAKGKLVIFGRYEDGTGKALGTVGADMALAAYAGAALSLVPADVARDCIRVRRLEPALQENFGEILNVLCCGFDAEGGRVKLASMVFPPDAATDDFTGGLHLSLDIDGYGEGLLSLRSAA
ncbi:hypothetical protein ACO2Q9_00950 [Variovorax sp. VNK109]|jgi:hypothetical protein|uniref:hypothetical protein n=1 Tax=Variovorax sp. VNK109 TaxID=3400919 RepID=UPI003C0C8081